MARAVWSGTVSFGLVTIPVRLFNAVSEKDVRFHELEGRSGRRVRHRRVVEAGEPPRADGVPEIAGRRELDVPAPGPPTEADDRVGREPVGAGEAAAAVSYPGPVEVAYEDVVKGYEVAPGQHVILSPDDIRALQPEPSRTIDIEDFVDLDQIDPVHFEKSYYVAPQRGAGAEKPYSLLLLAMREANRVGIARFVLRSKPYLAAIRPRDEVLMLETMYFGDEIRGLEEVDNLPRLVEPDRRELDMAVRLVRLMEVPWDPARYPDLYRERVMELIESRRSEGTVEVEEPVQAGPARVADLMAALKASLEARRAEDPANGRRIG
jgi:DNA end-binding protein Ku